MLKLQLHNICEVALPASAVLLQSALITQLLRTLLLYCLLYYVRC